MVLTLEISSHCAYVRKLSLGSKMFHNLGQCGVCYRCPLLSVSHNVALGEGLAMGVCSCSTRQRCAISRVESKVCGMMNTVCTTYCICVLHQHTLTLTHAIQPSVRPLHQVSNRKIVSPLGAREKKYHANLDFAFFPI